MSVKPTILLSYDVEEFDMPFEYSGNLSLEEQVAISTRGLLKLLHLLNKYHVKATFYCTAQYALAEPGIIKNLHHNGHEIASHTYYHSKFENADLVRSKVVLENIIQQPIHGLRMPRMIAVDSQEVLIAGYSYNSSLNPTWLPGKYNHFTAPRTLYYENGVMQLPASVTPWLRVPLFWLGLHNYPFLYYWACCQQTIRKDGYLNLYFHPWEFENYQHAGQAKFPRYVTRNCGNNMLSRTERLIKCALKNQYAFSTTYHYIKAMQKQR